MKNKTIKMLIGIGLLLLISAPPLFGTEEKADSQTLEQAANDPTASLMSVQVQDLYSGAYYKMENQSGNTLLLRSAVPFSTGPLNHIARATLPFITDSPSGKSGISDLVLFDLIVFDQSWGRWGVGPVMLFPTAGEEQLGTGKWAVGPAAGFVARSDKLMWGLFSQNLFSFAGENEREEVKLSILQPIINYSLPDKWSISASEMNLTYDWVKSAWTVIPLGVKVAKLVKFGKLPVQFSVAYEYNFADDFVAPQWAVNFTVKFLFPL